ncbi:LuxR C-terminal-related transcriptional regulator [Micromonospora sp. NPDC000089]|uniref:helix-turn-helix transcriptional regulator n=1 Tax=unclassified Micromonospora TaxID=2617518 RepID=UPI0036BD06BA
MHVVLVGSLDEMLGTQSLAWSRDITPLVIDEAAISLLAGGSELRHVDVAHQSAWYELLTRVALARQDLGAATGWAYRAVRASRASMDDVSSAFARLALAQVARYVGGRDKATRLALAAAGTFDRLGHPLDADRALLVAGVGRTKTDSNGDAPDSSVREGDAGPGTAARGQPDLIAQPVRAAGDANAMPLPLDVLSRREREVAEWVARGSTNRDIANHLFLSVKTVERHLSRIFDKVSVTSRAALAAMVARDPSFMERDDRSQPPRR